MCRQTPWSCHRLVFWQRKQNFPTPLPCWKDLCKPGPVRTVERETESLRVTLIVLVLFWFIILSRQIQAYARTQMKHNRSQSIIVLLSDLSLFPHLVLMFHCVRWSHIHMQSLPGVWHQPDISSLVLCVCVCVCIWLYVFMCKSVWVSIVFVCLFVLVSERGRKSFQQPLCVCVCMWRT